MEVDMAKVRASNDLVWGEGRTAKPFEPGMGCWKGLLPIMISFLPVLALEEKHCVMESRVSGRRNSTCPGRNL